MAKWWLLLAAMLMASCERPVEQGKPMFPWDIQVLDDGRSEVFGLKLETSTFAEAMQLYRHAPELALFDKQGKLTLEAYFAEVTSGGLSGKLIVTLLADDSTLQNYRARAVKKKPMDSGSVRFTLAGDDVRQSKQLVVKGVTYIPLINLQDADIRARFGEPEKLLERNGTLVHYLYPSKGLDLIMDKQGKEVLQYVAPRSFVMVTEPLQQTGREKN